MFASATRPSAQLRNNSAVIEQLRERIQGIEGSSGSIAERSGIPTGFSALDQLLADGGLKRGSLVEWLNDSEGSGAATLALRVAAHVLRDEGALVVIDEASEFYPVAADHLGIPLDRTLIVRPSAGPTVMWAWEQAMRCTGVAVTFGRIGKIDGRTFRRLQLAIETGGGLGFLMRSPEHRGGASWAGTSVGVRSANARYVRGANAHNDFARRLLVSVTRGHSGGRVAEIELELAGVPALAGEDSTEHRLKPGLQREIELELLHETDDVSLFSELADPMANEFATAG